MDWENVQRWPPTSLTLYLSLAVGVVGGWSEDHCSAPRGVSVMMVNLIDTDQDGMRA